MQVSKRLAQNLIEIVFIFPILLITTLVVFEVAMFWQDVNAVYDLNSTINANVALLDNTGYNLGDTCKAAKKAEEILKKYGKTITIADLTYTQTTLDGNEPFAYYKYESSQKITGQKKPLVALWVDCRNPFEDGITTQIEFYHKNLIIKAKIPTLNGDPIEIIPEHVYIASPKENTLRHY